MFHETFRLPRLEAHGMDPGEASADWVIYEYHGFHKKMNWRLGAEIASTLIKALRDWMMSDPTREAAWAELARRLAWLPARFQKYDQDAGRMVADCLSLGHRDYGAV